METSVTGGPSGIVYVKKTQGHRQSYVSLLSGLLDLRAMTGSLNPRRLKALLAAPQLLFATLDDSYAGFILITLLRSLMGKRTVALFLRPAQCFETGKLIYPVKRMVFRVLKKVPGLTILTIVPFSLDERLATVAHAWVHDPQMWDSFEASPPTESTNLQNQINEMANGRAVLSFVGSATTIKGFTYLHDIVQADPRLREKLFVAVAGKVSADCEQAASRLRELGMLLEDRFVTDAEIVALYQASDLVWCCYKPEYDQASGIFGRAVQYGRRPVVRAGALIDRYQAYTGGSNVALPYGEPKAAGAVLHDAVDASNVGTIPTSDIFGEWRAEFVHTVRAGL